VVGGTLVRVFGSGFDPSPFVLDDARCRFGQTVVPAMIRNDSEIVCVAPGSLRPDQEVGVAVSLNGGRDFSGEPDGGVTFLYVGAPSVHLISQGSGTTTGGTAVSVHGSGLDAEGLECLFGGGAGRSPLVAENASFASCLSPALPMRIDGPSAVPVQLMWLDRPAICGRGATSGCNFIYVYLPTVRITGVSPRDIQELVSASL